MNKNKCYIYSRVSTVAQVDGYSLDAQKERLRMYAESRGLEIVREYCDAGKSGKSIVGRPEFLQMMADITSERDGIAYVLVFKLSRFGRNAADILKSLQTLEDYEIDLVCVEDAIDSSTAGGKLTLTILSAVAEIERENINIQFTAGRMQKLMNGGWPGGPAPYGYRCVDKELAIRQEEAEIVRLIYERFVLDGGTVNGVTIWLNEHGCSRCGRPFTREFIARVLSNPIYHGKIVYSKKPQARNATKMPEDVVEVVGIHEPIVSDALWQQAAEKRLENGGRAEQTEDPERISLLSGLIKCPYCGGGLIASKRKLINKNNGGYYKLMHYYSCRQHRKSAGRMCNFSRAYNQEKVDSAVYEIVSNLGNIPAFEKALSDAMGGNDSPEVYEEQIKRIRKDIYHQNHERKRLGEELDNLDVLADDYDELYDRIQSHMDGVYDRIDELEETLALIKKKQENAAKGIRSVDNIRKILKGFHKFYDRMNCAERRELYRCIIDRIEVYPEERGDGRILRSIYFRFPVRYGDVETVEAWIDADRETEKSISFKLDCDGVRATVSESKATYTQIKERVRSSTGLKVSSLYIAQIKRKYGIEVGPIYGQASKKRAPQCPVDKELAIMDALKAFRMLPEDTEYKEAAV